MNTSRLHETAVLARIEITTWTGRILDRGASLSVARNAGAQLDAVRVRKNLLAGTDSALRAALSAAQYVRTLHRDLTLPWTESERILPAVSVLEYQGRIGTAVARFREHAESLIRDYRAACERARGALGDLWHASEYPAPDTVAGKFRVRQSLLPFPAVSDDWRVGLADAERSAIMAQARQAIGERLRDATRELWGRLVERLDVVSQRLADPDCTIKDALVTDTRALLERLASLNVTDDTAFASALHAVSASLASPTALRASDDTRARAASRFAALAAQYRGGAV